MRRPLKTFNDLLSRVDEFFRVKDDDRAANRDDFKREINDNGDHQDIGKGKKNKKKGGR